MTEIDKTNSKKEQKEKPSFQETMAKSWFAIAIMIFLVEFLHFIKFFPSDRSDPSNWGVVGDFFGGTLNPVLQFVVILMLFWSIRIQQQELKATRKELKESREANQLAATSLQEQASNQQKELELTTMERLLMHKSKSLDSFINETFSLNVKLKLKENSFPNNMKETENAKILDLQSLLNKWEYMEFAPDIINISARRVDSFNKLKEAHKNCYEILNILITYSQLKGPTCFIEHWLKMIIPVMRIVAYVPNISNSAKPLYIYYNRKMDEIINSLPDNVQKLKFTQFKFNPDDYAYMH